MKLENLNGFTNDVREEFSSEMVEDYTDRAAIIPECCTMADPMKEYENYPEERIWIPAIDESDDEWSPLFVLLARSALTYAQESAGISNREAMENSCSGYAEQYISNVFHYSGYVPEVALWRLLTKALPSQLVKRWSSVDTELFEEGLQKYGKRFFLIQSSLLPHKTTMDLVEFYYSWKRAKIVKGVGASRSRKFLRKRRRRSAFISYSTCEGMLTRSKRATRDNNNENSPNNIESDHSETVKRKRWSK